MARPRTRVLLTGATGNWGRAVLREFRTRADRIEVVALARRTPRDDAVLLEFHDMDTLTVIRGDLLDDAVVESCVSRVDLVLHVGGVVSPAADEHPDLARAVNIGSMRTIIRAVAAQPEPGRIGVVGIGSVAETGDRNPPHHWGRIGDPVRASQFDEYAQTKIIAERELVDSGLPKWAWLRQTGIFHPGVLQIRDPIMTHPPFAGVMEWVSAEDSARLLANLCEAHVPVEFWGGIYNVGGGEGWRLTNWQFQTALASAMGVRDVRRWYDRNWFALKNFHGQWYTDSDRLHELVPFRRDTFDEAMARAIAAAPRSVRSAGRVPGWIVKHLVVEPLTRRPRGTMAAVRSADEKVIDAFFGSRAAWEAIGDWATFVEPAPDRTPSFLDHGYDETKDPASWARADYLEAAAFRGGRLLTADVTPGDVATPLDWTCAFGHEFAASPRLVLTAGHWCPVCVRDPAGYARQAERNPFLAQVEGPG
ncbi:NAD-dependent epimerase/dehydratase family protein [Lacisediminihabitans profunda]|uniref:NAD(P)-dependent oxidoreductase n=1 Tax=Lacisediminihabitans profunda TaxID=2594790 RepID=A0A5C8UMS6_9MICO|nr:NAD(P)-dependent oxidoreductase [Lacisediminihabitans profunda]TXN29500.1 NAD(P)-dependent oxidoreductase [Lacisediminihabitans profunda]